ncbi:CRP/FNR family transcriptional regulator [Crossiella equi]|uniref:CRP/FNR family transcriptional regulator n=1 Tax=Crossiella equi TaxID=130796 RepID=A0ABS5A3L3_9PSEU|nr:Crp/Fnr family transcriptional regulator [Crossiella equi]MBP2471169.1 CRP/FNR family transcriptional regulator [Crossiella equi]
MTDELDANLYSSCLFRGLPTRDRRELKDSMVIEVYPRRSMIFAEGSYSDRLQIVCAGQVKLTATSQAGRQAMTALAGPGDVLELLPELAPGRRVQTATAATAVTTASITYEELRGWWQRRPVILRELLRELEAAVRMREQVRLDYHHMDVPARIAKLLLGLAKRFGQPEANTVLVTHHLTQTDMADLVCSVRESVNHAVTYFSERGWIMQFRTGTLLSDVNALARRAR